MRLTNGELLQAQRALTGLMELDSLPVKTSLDIALISNMVDSQVKVFGLVRDKLFKTYSIKASPGEKEGTIKFESTIEGETKEETIKLRAEKLNAFGEKFNELFEANCKEMEFSKIQLPSEVDGKPLKIKPGILKGLIEFIEVV